MRISENMMTNSILKSINASKSRMSNIQKQLSSGKKIFDEDKGDFVAPVECLVGDKKFLLPVIPPYRLAVGGSIPSKYGNHNTDAVILKEGDLRDSSTMKHFSKQGILYE